MKDSYLKFANTGFGAKLTSMLGLPQPLVLERYDPSAAVIQGSVLLGGDTNSELLNEAAKQLNNMSVNILTHQNLNGDSTLSDSTNSWKKGQSVKAAIFDASGLNESSEATVLYTFFNDCARSIAANGRVIILGRPPKLCSAPQKATAQRALEGFSRSLAKELRHAITVQLVYVEEAAHSQLESTLRFLLSPRSAYVSGQVINVANSSHKPTQEFDWSKPLNNKRVLVTGASQGIGAAIAEVMARDGATVVCLDVPQAQDALTATAARLNGRAIALDLSAPDAPAKLLEEANNDAGWDVVVHNAGITRDKTIAKMPPEWWDSVVNVNLSCQERINDVLVSAGGLKQGGRIVCVSSISGIAGNRGQSNYAFSKAGVIGMVESMAPLLKEKGITINAVAPGFIETKMTAAIPFTVREAGRRLNSMSQGGQAVDVAEAIAWLASPASSGLSANTVRVCGQSLLGA